MPRGQLHAAFRAALPLDANFAWRNVGQLYVPSRQLLVLDPGAFEPGNAGREGRILDWPFQEADVWLRTISRASGEVLRVAAVLLGSRGSDVETDQQPVKKEVGSSPIDSATMMVADRGQVDISWRVGGSLNSSVLGRSERDSSLITIKEQAAAILIRHGFRLNRDESHGYLSYRFDGPLSDCEIAEADRLLQEAGLPERVNASLPHTLAVIENMLNGSFVARLDDADSPYLYAFPTGWGDGIYWWDALLQRDKLMGYLCDFMPES